MWARIIIFLSGFAVAGILGFFAIQYAKGVRFDLDKLSFQKTGILVATSNPDGAQVLINGKLRTATNQTIEIAPDTYDVEITKEGYLPWRKRLTVKDAAVTKTDAILFPKAPSLSPITFDGAQKPFISPDGTKLVWIVPPTGSPSPEAATKTGLWILELANLPFGFSRNARQVTDADLSVHTLTWSPDGRTILAEGPKSVFLLEIGEFKRQGELVSQTPAKITQLKATWKKEADKETESKIKKLPDEMQDIIKRKATQFSFSLDETKVLYTASVDATIPEKLIEALPGSSTQKEERSIKKGQTYTYDIKEDRNFLVEPNSQNLIIDSYPLNIPNLNRKIVWLSTSRHLLLAEPEKITILEYDGTNRQPMWTASYAPPFAFTSPDGGQLIILTTLGASSGATNLYTINLR